MILTDGVHLVSTEPCCEELHAFAKGIGLKRRYFQDHRMPHYDLTTWRMGTRAFVAGAALLTTRELVRRAYRRARRKHPMRKPDGVRWIDWQNRKADAQRGWPG